MGNQTSHTEPFTLIEQGPNVCPVCKHGDLGTPDFISKFLRKAFRMRPPRVECPADDGFGGGFEHDGRCGCPDAFHS